MISSQSRMCLPLFQLSFLCLPKFPLDTSCPLLILITAVFFTLPSLTTQVNARIEEAFTKRVVGCDLVACYIETVNSDAAPAEEPASAYAQNRIEFLDRKGLHDFLYNRFKQQSGILQRFIEPQGVSNSMIRAIWSPKVCLLERRLSKHQLQDQRFGLYERACLHINANGALPRVQKSVASSLPAFTHCYELPLFHIHSVHLVASFFNDELRGRCRSNYRNTHNNVSFLQSGRVTAQMHSTYR